MSEPYWEPLAAAPVVVPDAGGWSASPDTWTFNSADAPNYYIQVTGDRTGAYWPGMRFRLTSAGVVKYFIVQEARFISGITYLTLYGGTDYTLAAGAITAPASSTAKAPQGFPLDPAKWSLEATLSGNVAQPNATASAWYNVGAVSL